MPQRILVTLDGSRPSESILPYVGSLLGLIDADLTLLRVVPPDSPEEIEKARRYLGRVAQQLSEKGIFVDVSVTTGKPAEKILEAAEQGKFDFLALASRRKKGLARAVLGSVAEEVLRRAHVPVLVTAAKPESVPAAPRSIVVPLDGSRRSTAVLEPVAALAKAAGAKISFVTVVSPRRTQELPASTAARTLFSHQDALQRQGLNVEIAVLFGDPVEEILRFAEARQAGLLALATHGRTGLARWRYGSVTETLLRKSGIPLLVVRSVARSRPAALHARAVEARRRALETAAAAARLTRNPYGS